MSRIELVELVDGGFELEFAAGDLQLLDEIGRSGEQHPPAVVVSARPMAAARWLLPPPGGPNSRILAPLASQPSPAAIAMTLALETIGTASKVKLLRVFPGGRWGLGKMPLDRAVGALGQLMLGDGREEAGGGPSLPIGLLGKLRPECLDRRYAELIEHNAEPGFVDAMSALLHATSPI